MNHCIDCGRRVSTGRCQATGEERRCMICETARKMATFYYISPAIKRRIKKEQEDGQGAHDEHRHGSSILKRI